MNELGSLVSFLTFHLTLKLIKNYPLINSIVIDSFNFTPLNVRERNSKKYMEMEDR